MPSVLWRCWLGSKKSIRPVKKLSGGVLAWLSFWCKVQTFIWPSWCHCHSLSLASVKSRLALPFWYRLTRVVPDKEPLNLCVCVCCFTLFCLTFACLALTRDAEKRLSRVFWCLCCLLLSFAVLSNWTDWCVADAWSTLGLLSVFSARK